MDAIFYNQRELTVVDWKYSEKSLFHVIANDPAHFRD